MDRVNAVSANIHKLELDALQSQANLNKSLT
jgi:hypothetical protein